jgi:hexosaminidase
MMCAASMLGLEMTVSAAVPGLVPVPAEMKETAGKPFQVGAKLKIGYGKDLAGAAEAAAFLADCLKTSGGVACSIKEGKGGWFSGKSNVVFAKGPGTLGTEGYTLSVSDKGVTICADAPAGFFYGVQTLRQLLPAEATFDGKPEARPRFDIPAVEIKDLPAYRWRGLMLDSCRHFFAKEEVKKIIDTMATQKLNTFHWHLTDDQAWRIEIKKHPKLTEVGGFRPGIGFGLDPKSSTHYRADGKYGGFYTQEDIKDVVAFAATRHITVVPEIEMPGHAMAALVAYPELNCNPEAMAKKSMPEGAGVFRDVYCAGKEDTFKFFEDVLGEVAELFPSKFVHVGGDECPKDNWKQCPACQQRIKDNGLKSEHELQSYVIRRVEKFLNSKNKNLIGWSEILEGGLAPNAAVMDWIGGGAEAAKQGHDVVMTPTSFCYFDYYQGKQGEPRAIGGFLPLKTVYSFDPVRGIPAEGRRHILGGQANLWTEYIPSDAQAEYMIAPRISALAEVVWSPKANQDWNAFQVRLGDQFKRYDAAGFNCRKSKDGDPK